MSFRATATVAGIIALVLGLGYLFAGHIVVGRWRLEPVPGVLLMGRRMGAVYVGLAVMLLAARSAGPSPARTAICIGSFVSLALLAVLGLYEFANGNAARGILVSAGVEFLLAIGFALVLFKDRRGSAAAGAA